MKNYIKYLLYLIVFIGFIPAKAGSYDDFFKAIDLDQPEVIVALLSRGFDPNSPSPQGQPALLLSYQKKSFKVLDVLITYKQTNLNVLNNSGENLLMLASLNNQLALVEKLIEKGADVNKPGWTALHYAATKGHIEVIKVLLDQQAYIDAESPNGTTPLMMAARYSTPKVVKLLLEEGADPRIRNQVGYDALLMAQKQASTESESYIKTYLADWHEKYDANHLTAPAAAPSVTEVPSALAVEPKEVTGTPEELGHQEKVIEVETGKPISPVYIESGQLLPQGEPEIVEIRPVVVEETDNTGQNPASVQAETVVAPTNNTPYSNQIRARAVVNIDLVGDAPLQPDPPDESQ